MSKTVSSPKVGDFVYKPFKVLQPGVVRKVYTKTVHGMKCVYCTVEWLDGTIDDHWQNHLNDFNHATDEHLSKYKKFDKLRTKLKGL